jgi:signal transduction histidine kinase/integral membrane sensor domain MASE1
MKFDRVRKAGIVDVDVAITALAVGFGYYVGSVVGLALTPAATVTSALWPPNAILTAAFIVLPTRRWTAAILGALPAHLAAQASVDWSLPLVLSLFATNCSEGLIAAVLLRMFSDEPTRFDTLGRFGAFIGSAVLAAPVLSTFADAAVVTLLHGDPYSTVWANRLPANALTQLTFTPAIVGVVMGAPRWIRRPLGWHHAEAAALTISLLMCGWLAFGTSFALADIKTYPTDVPILAQLPVVLWAALRFGPVGTSLALLGVTGLTAWIVVQGVWAVPADQLVLNMQVLLITTAVALLALATLIEERRQSTHALGERFRFEKLLSEFSRTFVQVPSERMNAVCHEALKRIGTFLDIDCVRLFQVTQRGGDIRLVSEWRSPGFGPSVPTVITRDYPWIVSRIESQSPLALRSLRALPPEAAHDRLSLESHGYNALLVLPLLAGERLVGALTFGAIVERDWSEDEIANLRLLSEVLANALARRQVDDALMGSEVMKSAILDSLTSGVAVIDNEGRLLNLNTNWTRLAEESGVIPYVPIREGDSLLDVFPADAVTGVKGVLNHSRARFVAEYVSVTPAATKFWLFVASRLNRAEGGAVVTLVDDTERRHAEIDAQQLRQELAHVGRVSTMGELAASLAHQLNQPLTGVMINAQAARRLLDRVPPDYDELREIMSDILGDARRASEVIQRVRGLLRRSDFEMSDVHLQAVLSDVANLVGSDAIIRNIAITLDLDPKAIVVRGDRVQLQQVVLNLLVNGMEAIGQTNAERVVRVSCRRTEDRGVRVMVHDSGVGLAEGAEKRVFDPFYTTKNEGMGMGLSIAQSIVEMHGGTITARNAGNRGTIVEFTLPLAVSPELV